MPLVERDEQLAVLGALASGLPGGSIALIPAEAGAGKTSLLRAFAERVPSGTPVHVGRCDDLAAPAPFAPLWDLAESLPAIVGDALDGRGPRVPVALASALRERPGVLILDDVQWADEATVDLIGHLGRRIDELPVVLCLAYRSDEVARDHPLRRVLGELGRRATRLELPALTLAAVRSLAVERGLDGTRIYARSRGNPFFVSELLADPGSDVSGAVSDAVLSRVANLPASVWSVLEPVALAPQGLPLSMLESFGPDAELDADLVVERGLLEVTAARLRCRHDLVRTALAAAVPPVRARTTHRRLAELLAPVARTPAEVAQVAAHAVAGGDGARAASFSLRAARTAAADGAHRQAVRHLANALDARAHLSEAELDHALDAGAREAYFTHDPARALDWALELRARTPDADAALGGRRAWTCSRLAHFAGDDRRALALADEALLLFTAGADRVRESYTRWWRAYLSGDDHAVRRWRDATAGAARAAGELEIAAHVLVSVGSGADETIDELVPRVADGLALAREAGSLEQTARAYCNLAYVTTVNRRPEAADRWLDEGLAWTRERDLTFWWDAMVDSRALLRMHQGRWDDALADAALTLDGEDRAASMQVCAANARATILLRRGDADAEHATLVGEDAARHSGHDRLLATAVRAEAAWLHREAAAADSIAEDLLSGSTAGPWLTGPVVFWLHKLAPGAVPTGLGALPEPVSLELAGDLAGAAAGWRALGLAFEAAVVDGLGDDGDALRRAFSGLTALGAEATAARLRQAAEQRGVRSVPRGARASTASDPDGLTRRQIDVLRLLGERLTDAEIAARLYISEKTVGHHVSAILARLGVDGRREAGAHARARFPSAPG